MPAAFGLQRPTGLEEVAKPIVQFLPDRGRISLPLLPRFCVGFLHERATIAS
jgi:hypothetical protein